MTFSYPNLTNKVYEGMNLMIQRVHITKGINEKEIGNIQKFKKSVQCED